MTADGRPPVLYLVACGARAAGLLAPFIAGRQEDGWDVCVVATPSALTFMNAAAVAAQTGHVVRSTYKQPDEPDVLPPADAIIVAPATFNTINKWANGNSDTLALGLLNEAIGLNLPIAAVPTPNVALARHPAFIDSITRLRSWGVRMLYDPEVFPLPTPNMGPQAAALFPWMELASQSRELLARTRTEPGGWRGAARASRSRPARVPTMTPSSEDDMTDEQQIRTLIERWAIAVHDGDLDTVLADHDPDIVMFDVPPPNEGVRGIHAYRDTWPPFFEWQASGAVFQIESLDVTAGTEVAFAYALLRCGTPAELARQPGQRLRLTLGLRKTGGRWTVLHEHHSFPDTTSAP